MRTLVTTWLCIAPLIAQDESPDMQAVPDIHAIMEQLALATNELERAIAQHDRSAYEQPLASLLEQVAQLRPKAPQRPIDELYTAVRDLRNPIDEGGTSDAWDFARLRSACTACHLQVRSDNKRRGVFPNRGNVVTGTLQLLDRSGSAVRDASNVVVFLEAAGEQPQPQPRSPIISQRGRQFDPAVLAVSAGTAVRFPNDDLVFHNVFSLSRGNAFDLGIYGKGKAKARTLRQPGLVKIHCNIHPDMASHILVLNSHRHAVTESSGFWAIPDVPDGDYTLRTWHVLANELSQPLQVRSGTIVTVPLVVRETKRRAQHNNKHGRRYHEGY